MSTDSATTTPPGQLVQFERWTTFCPKCEMARDHRLLGWTSADKRIGRAQCMVCGHLRRLEV